MKKYLNLSIIASLVVTVLTYQVAVAKSSNPVLNKDVADENLSEKVKIYINSQQRSLYQVALLSGISVAELRELNKGAYDKVDVVKVGESIVLPISSPLLPVDNNSNANLSNKYELPQLGSSDKAGAPKDDEVLERHVATALSTLASQDWEHMSSDKIKNQVQDDAQRYAENYVRNQVQSNLVDPVRNAAQDFLGRFGTAQLGFNVSDQGRLNNVSLKLFSPWYDSDNTLIFSQMSFQEYENNRRIGNFGIGQRWDVADKSWLLGYNVFLDHDFQRAHNRLGLGLEAWSDYLKLAVNYYYPLSDWKDSRDFENYLERAARGFDVRFQGYLPSYPHLGGSLMFEQYFGDEVALFGKDNLQKDPYAVTIGVDYTPVPLFTLRGEHKQGQDSRTDAKLDLTMNYRIGVPLKDQLDPDMVAAARSLRGSRYDLVDRNNNIVLEYKENKLSVDLASIGEQPEKTLFPVGIMVRGAKGAVSSITWNGTDLAQLLADGGDLCYDRGVAVTPGAAVVACPAGNVWNAITTTDYNNWSIAVPPFTNAAGIRNPAPGTTKTAGRYTFSVTINDSKNSATSNEVYLSIKSTSRVELENISEDIASLTNPSVTGKLGSSAEFAAFGDGISTIILEGQLVDSTNNPFNDADIYASYPATTTTPTADDVAIINQLWKATLVSDGSPVVFVPGGPSINNCPTDKPNCLLVNSITKMSPTDKYQVGVATSTELSAVKVSLNLTPYSDNSSGSNTQTIYFVGGVPVRLGLFEVGNPTRLALDSGGKLNVPRDSLKIGRTYEVKSYSDIAATVEIPNSHVRWGLEGSNASACFTDATTIPTGKYFWVAAGLNVTYQLLGVNESLASTPETSPGIVTSLDDRTVDEGPITMKTACAGDQGFGLWVEAVAIP